MFFKKYSKEKAVRVTCLFLSDVVCINLASFLALFLRYEFNFDAVRQQFLMNFLQYIPINTLLTVIIFALFRLYNSLWQYASFEEAYSVVFACAVSSVVHFVGSTLVKLPIPRSCYVTSGFILILLTIGTRFVYRAARKLQESRPAEDETGEAPRERRIMIIGAGEAADVLIREIATSSYLNNCTVVAVIDDSPAKIGQYIHGIRIFGGRDTIKQAAMETNANEIIFAIPTASLEDRAAILNICKETECKLETLPGVYQMLNGEVKIGSVRDVEIEDLLGREPVRVDLSNVMNYVHGKTVLVTGGGGSIGSELCRQIARYGPKLLIIFDVYENNAYDIQNELLRNFPDLNLIALIGSVRDTKRINSVMETYRPDIVYHAAAHKHVPLMEVSPNEAIKNNVFGTLKTVQAADRWGVKRFVMISTDKAVNPTNVMGATKRMCEMIIQMYNGRSKTDYVAVRFGNVLGSNGSVIPLFKRQIEKGGPVTVTDPNIIRYFMTIPEAVSLVLEAGALAKGGEIFVLDMGKPVRILDLAENLIRLSGHMPYVDIDIEFTGLRPGEKLYEELLMDEEGMSTTPNKLIHIGHPIEFNEAEYEAGLEHLRSVMMDDTVDIRAEISKLVPTFRAPEEVNARREAELREKEQAVQTEKAGDLDED